MNNINNQKIVTPRTTELISKVESVNVGTEISFWVELFKKYEETISLYKFLFQENQLIKDIIPNIKSNDMECSLTDYIITFCQNKESVRLYLTGVGGSGKTVSLLYLCKELLKKNIPALYIPLSRVNDSGSELSPLARWIKDRILLFDDSHPEVDATKRYERMLASINSSFNNSFVLVLDGVNEMSNPHLLLKELEIWNSLRSVSIVISSRNNEFFNIGNSAQFHYCEMIPLSEIKILEFLKKRNLMISKETPELKTILALPQMLALYAGTSTIKERYAHARGLDWRESKCISDIIHNHIVCQIADVVYEKQLCSCYVAIFTMNFALPKLAWIVYKSKTNFIERKDIKEGIKQLINEVSLKDSLPDILDQVWRPQDELVIREISFLLLDQLALLEEFNKSQFCFVHQNYFDYFISQYWINSAVFSMDYQESTCWNSDIIPTAIENYFSETEGKLFYSDFRIINNYWEFLRKKEIPGDDLCLLNLLRIMEQRYNWNLSSLDFSDFDLRATCLNGTILSDGVRTAVFRNSQISEHTFSPQGHHAAIMQTFFFFENPNILYTKDLHGNLGMYDIVTDKRISMEYGKLYGGGRQILLAGSKPDTLLIPDMYTFLDEMLLGMNQVKTETQEVEYISVGKRNFMVHRAIQYLVDKKKWLILSHNKVNLIDSSKTVPDSEDCILDIEDGFRYYKLIENRKQSVLIFSLISKDSPYTEKLLKYQVCTGECSCIYAGAILVGKRQSYLSDDGLVLTISDENANVIVVGTEDGTIKRLYSPEKFITQYNGYVLMSPDNQWCIWYGPTGEVIYPWNVFIWNLWNPEIFLTYEYDDIISSSCFTLDSKGLILGLFDGSIDTISLHNFVRHRLAVGHRVDQKMYIVDNILHIRRSDGFYQKWDVKKHKILEAPCRYSFPEQKIYDISELGGKWFTNNHTFLQICLFV